MYGNHWSIMIKTNVSIPYCRVARVEYRVRLIHPYSVSKRSSAVKWRGMPPSTGGRSVLCTYFVPKVHTCKAHTEHKIPTFPRYLRYQRL